ncbi:hypothetical protein OKW43_005179 [Paraburkholderia sp. WC7.3g]|uniref:hypothetical protein n=1 Tax=Paraburkholderia sp. WC7.3g TaxID=2991070 RepID=UPI003D1A279F
MFQPLSSGYVNSSSTPAAQAPDAYEKKKSTAVLKAATDNLFCGSGFSLFS